MESGKDRFCSTDKAHHNTEHDLVSFSLRFSCDADSLALARAIKQFLNILIHSCLKL